MGQQMGRIAKLELPAMHEIGMIARRDPVQHRMGVVDDQIVPSHMRYLQPRRGDRGHIPADPVEARRFAVFMPGGRQHLHAHADAQKRHAAQQHRLAQRLGHAVHLAQGAAACGKGAVARQHDPVGPDRERRVRGHHHLGPGIPAHQLERLFRRMQVAAVIVDQRDPHHSAPLVEGRTPAIRGSGSTASRSARATALKAASAIWWLLRPWRRSTCSVMPPCVDRA